MGLTQHMRLIYFLPFTLANFLFSTSNNTQSTAPHQDQVTDPSPDDHRPQFSASHRLQGKQGRREALLFGPCHCIHRLCPDFTATEQYTEIRVFFHELLLFQYIYAIIEIELEND